MPECQYRQNQEKAPRMKMLLHKQTAGKELRKRLPLQSGDDFIKGYLHTRQGYQYLNASSMENYMLDQVLTTACARNQHIAGGRGGVLIFVRKNMDYDQTDSGGGQRCRKQLPSNRGLVCEIDSGHIMEVSTLRQINYRFNGSKEKTMGYVFSFTGGKYLKAYANL